jgi:hypothetical protein
VTALSEARDALTEWLPLAHAIIAIPDTSARTRASGRPGSRPPWNQANANAEMDTLATIADILADFRYTVTGRTGPRPPASATGPSLDLIVSLGHAVPQHQRRAAERNLMRCVIVIQQLPAVDQDERPQRIPGAPCAYCRIPMLMTLPKAGIVYCKLGGAACWDSNGDPPRGHVTVGRLGACVEWADGLVT